MLIRKVSNTTAKLLQFAILCLLINLSLPLAIASYLLLPMCEMTLCSLTYLRAYVLFELPMLTPLCRLLGTNCILQSVLLLLAYEVRRAWGPSPSLEESLGFWASYFSEAQFLICKMGNDNIEFSGLFRALMRDKYKAFIIKPRPKDSFHVILCTMHHLASYIVPYYYSYSNLLWSGYCSIFVLFCNISSTFHYISKSKCFNFP